MKINKIDLEALKIIRDNTEKQEYMDLSILERILFEKIGFEYALQQNIRIIEITRRLSKSGLIEKKGLGNITIKKGKKFLNQIEMGT